MLVIPLALVLQTAVPPPDSLTLDAALRNARSNRASLSVAAANVQEAAAGRRLASRPPNPTLEYSSVAVTHSTHLSARQALAPLTRIGAERSAAGALIDAARFDSVQRVADIDRDVTRAFYGALAGAERVRLLSELATLADSLGVLAGRRAQAGDISELDREQLVLEGTRARLQLSRALEERAARSAALARELAWRGTTPPAAMGRLDALLSVSDTAAAVSIDAMPAVQAARASARAASLTERSLRSARIPVPGLLFERDWSRTPGIETITRLGVSVPLPLFSRGNEALDIAAARARRAASESEEVSLEAQRAVAAARARVVESARRARLAADTLLTGVVRLRVGAVRLYDAGRTSVLQVLEALRAERDAQLATIDELLAFQEARADLAALLGVRR
jgi:cobalt-zinc-cadmium efflux system outer membrane protein